MNQELFCGPHLARTGEKIPAVRVVADTPMCLACFRGKPIDPVEDHFGLPFFIADALNGKNAQAHAHGKDAGRGEAA
jgi:hypothetical protein